MKVYVVLDDDFHVEAICESRESAQEYILNDSYEFALMYLQENNFSEWFETERIKHNISSLPIFLMLYESLELRIEEREVY